MAQLRFDIGKVLSEAFGGGSYVGKPFPNEPTQPGQSEPIVDGLNHQGTNGVYYMTPTSLNGYQLPNEPVIAISSAKKIVETPLAGNKRKGTVKEIINTEDWRITIRGVIINENSKDYPFSEVEELKDLYEINEDIPIVNAVTKALGIENVVIRNISLPEMVGRPNIQAYQISCVSDEDFVLIKE